MCRWSNDAWNRKRWNTIHGIRSVLNVVGLEPPRSRIQLPLARFLFHHIVFSLFASLLIWEENEESFAQII